MAVILGLGVSSQNTTTYTLKMMKKTAQLALMALLMTLGSCVMNGTIANHPTEVSQVNQTTAMSPFDEIDLAGGMNVVLEQGTTYSARVETSAAAFEHVVIYVANHTLHIGNKRTQTGSLPADSVTVYVTTPSLNEIELSGAGNITSTQPLNATNMHIELTGSGNIDIASLTCTELDVELTGSGNITIGTLHASDVDTSITGSGNVTFKNITALRAESEISGSGFITLSGHVDSHREDISGTGAVNTQGLK